MDQTSTIHAAIDALGLLPEDWYGHPDEPPAPIPSAAAIAQAHRVADVEALFGSEAPDVDADAVGGVSLIYPHVWVHCWNSGAITSISTHVR